MARFVVGSVLDVAALAEQFDTVLDSGLFHVLEDGDRAVFVAGLRGVVVPGGRYFLLCFSDRQPGVFGPRRISQDEIRAAFADGWRVDSIEPVMIDSTVQRGAAHAWLAVITASERSLSDRPERPISGPVQPPRARATSGTICQPGQMPDAVSLRDLDPSADRVAVERLWAAAIGNSWPVLPAALAFLGTGVIADAGGEPVGVIAVEAGADRRGGVQLLLVHPSVQGQGIGTRLLGAGIERLRALGVTAVALGSGGHDYLWPGVPEDLPGAAGFFAARGWRFDRDVLDLVADLRRYQAPPGTLERAERAGVTIEVQAGRDSTGPGSGPAPVAEVLAFEAANFPNWLRAFQRATSPVLVARDGGGAIVGALLFRGPPDATIFTPMLGADAGTIGCVGVTATARGAGLGSAMVARASELLREAGTGVCHISWTEREWFYRRVGYLPWRRYHMAERPIRG